MQFLYSCFILCFSIIPHIASIAATEEKEQSLPHTLSQFLMESHQPLQDYQRCPDYQYLNDRFKKDIESGKPFEEIQFQIGSCYFSGVKDHIKENYDYAAWWYNKSAARQYAPARDMLELLTKSPYKNANAELYLGLLKAQTALGVTLSSQNWDSC